MYPLLWMVMLDGQKKNNVSKIEAYRKGIKAAENIIEICKKYKIKYLTLFAFSLENWNREQSEVKALMILLKEYLENLLKNIQDNNISILFIGNHEKLPLDIKKLMDKITEISKDNKDIKVIIALSYSGRDQIKRSINRILLENKTQDIEKIMNKIDLKEYLDTKDIPDPDLLIRTSGEQRISNFMLWELAYTELYFTQVLWPDFEEKHLLEALENFNTRERRYGK